MKTKKRMLKKVMLATIITYLLGTAFSSQAHAEETQLQKKSIGIATALALDPIPGDALYYAGKPVQGTVNLILGGLGGALFYSTIVHKATKKPCEDGDMCAFSSLGEAIGLTFGGLLYFPMLLWDGIGGISGVQEHNKQVSHQKSVSVIPTINVDKRGTMFGLQGTF